MVGVCPLSARFGIWADKDKVLSHAAHVGVYVVSLVVGTPERRDLAKHRAVLGSVGSTWDLGPDRRSGSGVYARNGSHNEMGLYPCCGACRRECRKTRVTCRFEARGAWCDKAAGHNGRRNGDRHGYCNGGRNDHCHCVWHVTPRASRVATSGPRPVTPWARPRSGVTGSRACVPPAGYRAEQPRARRKPSSSARTPRGHSSVVACPGLAESER